MIFLHAMRLSAFIDYRQDSRTRFRLCTFFILNTFYLQLIAYRSANYCCTGISHTQHHSSFQAIIQYLLLLLNGFKFAKAKLVKAFEIWNLTVETGGCVGISIHREHLDRYSSEFSPAWLWLSCGYGAATWCWPREMTICWGTGYVTRVVPKTWCWLKEMTVCWGTGPVSTQTMTHCINCQLG